MDSLSNYKFGKNFLKQSAGDFKHSVKARYKELSEDEINALVDREYGKSPMEIEVIVEEIKADGNGTGTKAKGRAAKK